MTVTYQQFGPGKLTIGEVATIVDFTCQVVNAIVEWEQDKDDDVVTLCGDTVPGSSTWSASLSGKLYQDLDSAAGIVFYSWEHKGEVVPFEFVPSTAAGATVTGEVTLVPITVGADEPKKNMDSDFTWPCVGEPTIAAGGVMAADTFSSDEDDEVA